MRVVAHLNGGPRDDQEVELTGDRFRVARPVDLRSMLSGPDWSPSSPEITTRTGTYLMRRDATGQPVPHDITGVVDFDWQGWDK